MILKSKKTDRRLSLKRQFIEAVSCLKDSKNYIWFIFLLFFLYALIGYINVAKLSFLNVVIRDIVFRTQGMNTFELIFYILQNNLLVSFFGLVFGMFFGIFPIIAALTNGLVLGYVLNLAVGRGGLLVAWRLFPHGIFELPAIFISLAFGLKLGWMFVSRYFSYYFRKRNIILVLFGVLFFPLALIMAFIVDKKLRKGQYDKIRDGFYDSMNVFLFIVVPLLIIAAVIEGLLIYFIK